MVIYFLKKQKVFENLPSAHDEEFLSEISKIGEVKSRSLFMGVVVVAEECCSIITSVGVSMPAS